MSQRIPPSAAAASTASIVRFRSRQEPDRNGVALEAFVHHLERASLERELRVTPLQG